MLLRATCFLFAILPACLLSQNLIPNPGFEDCKQVGFRWISSQLAFEKSIWHWSCPLDGSPDIILDKVRDRMLPVRPNVDLTDYLPHRGRIMVGIKTYGCAINDQHCKEYLQTDLIKPLLPGKTYLFSAWVRPLQNGILSAAFGIAISRDSLHRDGSYDLYDIAHTPLPLELSSLQEDHWQQISCEITPRDTAYYLQFGNFSTDAETPLLGNVATPVPYSYWLLDDFSLFEKGKDSATKLATLHSLTFNFDNARLSKEGQQLLTKIAENLLQHNPDEELAIYGNTDDLGSTEYNLALSQRRAEATARYMKLLGITNISIIEGKGESEPLVPNDSDEQRNYNRRVEIWLLNGSQ